MHTIVAQTDALAAAAGLVMRKGDPEFRLLVDRVLAQIYRTGDIEAIYSRWLGPLGTPSVGLMGMYLLNSLPE